MEAELQPVAEKIPRQQNQRRRIGQQDRNISQGKEPPHQETMVVAEHFRDISIGSARTLYAADHLMVVESQHDDGHRADQKSDDRSRGSGFRQEH